MTFSQNICPEIIHSALNALLFNHISNNTSFFSVWDLITRKLQFLSDANFLSFSIVLWGCFNSFLIDHFQMRVVISFIIIRCLVRGFQQFCAGISYAGVINPPAPLTLRMPPLEPSKFLAWSKESTYHFGILATLWYEYHSMSRVYYPHLENCKWW